MPPSIWPSDRQRVERPPDVLRRGDLDHLHQAELDVDVDDGPVGDERERRVAVALAVLVELLGRRMAILDRLVEREAGASPRRPAMRQTRHRRRRRRCRRRRAAAASSPFAAATARTAARAPLDTPRRPLPRSSTSGATPTWIRPSRPRCRSVEHDLVDAEDRPGDLAGDRDEPLTHLGRGELERGHAVGEPAAGGRVVVEALGVHEVLDRHAPADAAHDVAGFGGAPGTARQRASTSRRRPRSALGIGSAAVSRMHCSTGATFEHLHR